MITTLRRFEIHSVEPPVGSEEGGSRVVVKGIGFGDKSITNQVGRWEIVGGIGGDYTFFSGWWWEYILLWKDPVSHRLAFSKGTSGGWCLETIGSRVPMKRPRSKDIFYIFYTFHLRRLTAWLRGYMQIQNFLKVICYEFDFMGFI